MTIKLARLPERNPVKLTVSLSPEFHQALGDYAALYAETYGQTEGRGRFDPLHAPGLSREQSYI